jgi:hypothetical protein
MIPDFYKGKPATAQDIKQLAAEVKSNRITTVIGGRFQRGIHGTTIIVDPPFGSTGGTSAATGSEYPFQVAIYTDDSDPETPVVGLAVNEDSFLMKDASGDTVTISNLSSFLPTPTLGQQIVLEITLDQYLIPASAMFKVGAWQDIWPSYTNPIYRDPVTKVQEKLIVGIAECSSIDDTRDGILFPEEEPIIKIIQLVKTDLCCFLSQVRGLPALLAMPWHRHNQIE